MTTVRTCSNRWLDACANTSCECAVNAFTNLASAITPGSEFVVYLQVDLKLNIFTFLDLLPPFSDTTYSRTQSALSITAAAMAGWGGSDGGFMNVVDIGTSRYLVDVGRIIFVYFPPAMGGFFLLFFFFFFFLVFELFCFFFTSLSFPFSTPPHNLQTPGKLERRSRRRYPQQQQSQQAPRAQIQSHVSTFLEHPLHHHPQLQQGEGLTKLPSPRLPHQHLDQRARSTATGSMEVMQATSQLGLALAEAPRVQQQQQEEEFCQRWPKIKMNKGGRPALVQSRPCAHRR